MLQMQLRDLVGEEILEQILSSFTKATGLRAVIVDRDGKNRITSKDFPDDCEFCTIIRSTELGCSKCEKSYARAGKESAKYGEPYIFRCHAGLVAWAAPIMLDDEHVGSIICSQVLMWEPEEFFWQEIKEMCSSLNLDLEVLMEAAKKLEILSAERVQGAADLLFFVANHLMKTGMTNLQQRREIAEHQARLGEEMQARKALESVVKEIESRSNRIYALEKEQELISAVRKGERDTSYRLLNELLADIIQKYPDDSKEVKSRLLELIVLLSRAAIEGGANLKLILSLNSKYLEELNNIDSIEDQCLWILKVTHEFIDSIDKSSDIKNLQVIQKSAEFMRKNFNKKLTIDDISQAVYLSPCYLSKIFKQELGCTIMEYLTKVRIDEAKKYLRNPRYNIMQVANLIGFDDPSYFTKVFKKSEGITPSQYKRKAL
jgi:two-component system response regulator YesN